LGDLSQDYKLSEIKPPLGILLPKIGIKSPKIEIFELAQQSTLNE
jgi:hypothetical protein